MYGRLLLAVLLALVLVLALTSCAKEEETDVAMRRRPTSRPLLRSRRRPLVRLPGRWTRTPS